DLLAAAEAAGDDRGIGTGLAQARQQSVLGDLDRPWVFSGFEAERAGHAAAAVGHDLGVDAELLQYRSFRLGLGERMLMTMHLDQRFAVSCRPVVVDAVLGEKFAQEKTLLFQTAGALVIGKQSRDLVAESSEARRFE